MNGGSRQRDAGRFAVLIMSRTAMGMVYGRVVSAAPLARDVGVSAEYIARGRVAPSATMTGRPG